MVRQTAGYSCQEFGTNWFKARGKVTSSAVNEGLFHLSVWSLADLVMRPYVAIGSSILVRRLF